MEGVLQYNIPPNWSEVYIILIFVVELLEIEVVLYLFYTDLFINGRASLKTLWFYKYFKDKT